LRTKGGDLTERKAKLIMLSTVLILAIIFGIAATVYANGVTNDTNIQSNVVPNYGGCFGGGHGFGRRGFGWGGMPITVSEDYKNNVINIAKNDSDVQALLTDGYNITDVRPIISATVEADGTVTMKAMTAIVMLEKDTTGKASVTVNVGEGKVTEIVILTRTVIDKSST
jgi:hypothetical protein